MCSKCFDVLIFFIIVFIVCFIGEDVSVDFNGECVLIFGVFVCNVDGVSIVGLFGISILLGLLDCGLLVGLELDGLVGGDCCLLEVVVCVEVIFGIILFLLW